MAPVDMWQTATLETEICGQRLSTARTANEPHRRWNRLGRPTDAAAGRGNVALSCGGRNHAGTRGLRGGAEGIRTDGPRRSVRIPARPSDFLQCGTTLTCVQAPKTGSLLVSSRGHGPAPSQQEPRRGSDGGRGRSGDRARVFSNAALRQGGLDLGGNVEKRPAPWRLEPKFLAIRLHSLPSTANDPSLALGALEFGCRESADCRRSTTTCANNGSCRTDATPSTDDVTLERDQSIPKYCHRDSQTDFRNRRFAST